MEPTLLQETPAQDMRRKIHKVLDTTRLPAKAAAIVNQVLVMSGTTPDEAKKTLRGVRLKGLIRVVLASGAGLYWMRTTRAHYAPLGWLSKKEGGAA